MKQKSLFTVHRVVAWAIVPFMAVYVVSGYAYTRKVQFIHRGLAFDLHNTLDLPLMVLIVAHILLGARFELMRCKIKGRPVDIFLLVLGIVLVLILLTVDMRIPQ